MCSASGVGVDVLYSGSCVCFIDLNQMRRKMTPTPLKQNINSVAAHRSCTAAAKQM